MRDLFVITELDPTAFPCLCQMLVRPAVAVTVHNNQQLNLNRPTVTAPVYRLVIWLFRFSSSTEKTSCFLNISKQAAVTCSHLYRWMGIGWLNLVYCC